MINQAVLANRRAAARLFVNLMEVDLKKDVFLRRKLEERIQAWKIMQKEFIFCNFRLGTRQEKMKYTTESEQKFRLGRVPELAPWSDSREEWEGSGLLIPVTWVRCLNSLPLACSSSEAGNE